MHESTQRISFDVLSRRLRDKARNWLREDDEEELENPFKTSEFIFLLVEAARRGSFELRLPEELRCSPYYKCAKYVVGSKHYEIILFNSSGKTFVKSDLQNKWQMFSKQYLKGKKKYPDKDTLDDAIEDLSEQIEASNICDLSSGIFESVYQKLANEIHVAENEFWRWYSIVGKQILDKNISPRPSRLAPDESFPNWFRHLEAKKYPLSIAPVFFTDPHFWDEHRKGN